MPTEENTNPITVAAGSASTAHQLVVSPMATEMPRNAST